LWPDVLEIVKQTSRRTRALLDNAQITGCDGSKVTLAAPAALAKMIAEDSNTTVLRDALTQVVGGTWQVAVEAGTGAEPLPSGEPQGSAPSSARASRPPEPDPRDDLDESDTANSAPSDPEADAMKLLQDRLGARPVD
jgi:DNA polymerase-3 subunit gamma/tau